MELFTDFVIYKQVTNVEIIDNFEPDFDWKVLTEHCGRLVGVGG